MCPPSLEQKNLPPREGNSGIYEIKHLLLHKSMFKFEICTTFK